MKKVFELDNGLRLTEDDLLLYVSQEVQPSDEHFLTFIRTFDALIALLKGENPKPLDVA